MSPTLSETVLLDVVRRAVAARSRAEDDFKASIAGARQSGVPVADVASAAAISEGRVRDILSEMGGPRVLSREEIDHVLTWTPGVVIVAAGWKAYPEYRRYSAYVCQLHRGFNGDPVRMGFYADKAVMPEVPKILEERDNVLFTTDAAAELRDRDAGNDSVIATVVERMLADGARGVGFLGKVFLLSDSDSDDTMTLPWPVVHTTTGPGTGFTQKQRYISEGALNKHPTTTDELLRIEQQGT